jgi:hypothetical protein
MCEHLAQLEAELIARDIPVTFRGQSWSTKCREWVYFTCYLDLAEIRKRLSFAPCVLDHVNADPRSGEERGLVCDEHNDAIMGMPRPSEKYPTIT